ncbi:MAG: DUF4861 domain-containing protein [Prevotellaceae bacterium]|jgi:hypothetical protein|nr:DUF4861 domain-containing protein [Prevotellaceae bacterium]
MKKMFFPLLFAGLVSSCQNHAVLTVDVVNALDANRSNETVEVPWGLVQERIGAVSPQEVAVFNELGQRLPVQALYKGQPQPQSVIFQVEAPAQGSATYQIMKEFDKQSEAATGLSEYKKTAARLVPERMDDFAWENNRIAYRIYGPALMKVDGPSNGIDMWCKRTEDLIVDKWYAADLSGKASYHQDHGEGLDGYKVGRTLGCGALAPYVNGQLVLGNNFVTSKIVDSGPIRTSFELTYAPLDVAGTPVVEVRRISLDANSQLNCISEMFINAGDMEVAAGIVLKNNKIPATVATADPAYKPLLDPDKGYVTYAEQADALSTDTTNNGVIHTAIIFPPSVMSNAKLEGNHLLATGSYKANEPFTYYSGGGWSKAITEEGTLRFPTEALWQEYIAFEAQKLSNPLELKFK